MDLQTKLHEDMKAALKAGLKDRLAVIRMLLSDVKNIDLMPNKPTAQQAVEAYGKKLRKSMDEYQRIGRAEEVRKLQEELAIVEEYLPKKASPEETERLVTQFLESNSFAEKDLGRAMGAFMKSHGQSIDASIANASLKRQLQGK
ncbi:MAG: GatB/YqeY domain-containing protein [Phycisphaerales bacterium]|jgi:uncharacterized protein YqeY|nr:GatB/YqeY domain-containing protein [Phycisphaerales bacterium]